jgi:hypothetical protein
VGLRDRRGQGVQGFASRPVPTFFGMDTTLPTLVTGSSRCSQLIQSIENRNMRSGDRSDPGFWYSSLQNSLDRHVSFYGTHTHTHNSLRPEVSNLEGTYTLFDLSTAYILS